MTAEPDLLAEITGPCPCCAGEDEGDWMDLCDLCAGAWVGGHYPHGCARPVTEGTTDG